MRRMLWAALAGPALLALAATDARAQGCATGNCGGGFGGGGFGGGGFGGGGAAFGRPGIGVPPFAQPFGFAYRLFPGLHQHGPLVNYGPYSGYYPFEPYGPWTSDLRYNGPTGPQGVGTGWAPHIKGLFHHGYLRRGLGSDCGSCGRYALATFHNVGSRLNPFHRFGCGTACKSGCGN